MIKRNIFFYLKDMFGVATPARLKMIILGFNAYIWKVRLGLNKSGSKNILWTFRVRRVLGLIRV